VYNAASPCNGYDGGGGTFIKYCSILPVHYNSILDLHTETVAVCVTSDLAFGYSKLPNSHEASVAKLNCKIDVFIGLCRTGRFQPDGATGICLDGIKFDETSPEGSVYVDDALPSQPSVPVFTSVVSSTETDAVFDQIRGSRVTLFNVAAGV